MATLLLADNGSKQAAATLALRQLAMQLSERLDQRVYPVSLQHADTIPEEELEGVPAWVLEHFLKVRLQQGETEFILLPLFFGKSRALTSFIPDVVSRLSEEYGQFSLTVADVIVPLPAGEPALAALIYENIRQAAGKLENYRSNKHGAIVLVDHGSPVKAITEVRNKTAIELQGLLGDDYQLSEAVMERREGEEYDFNGPLLQNWLGELARSGISRVMVAMMFFLPGRHAGPMGDVEEICEGVRQHFPELEITISPLIASQPGLLDILQARLAAAQSAQESSG